MHRARRRLRARQELRAVHGAAGQGGSGDGSHQSTARCQQPRAAGVFLGFQVVFLWCCRVGCGVDDWRQACREAHRTAAARARAHCSCSAKNAETVLKCPFWTACCRIATSDYIKPNQPWGREAQASKAPAARTASGAARPPAALWGGLLDAELAAQLEPAASCIRAWLPGDSPDRLMQMTRSCSGNPKPADYAVGRELFSLSCMRMAPVMQHCLEAPCTVGPQAQARQQVPAGRAGWRRRSPRDCCCWQCTWPRGRCGGCPAAATRR